MKTFTQKMRSLLVVMLMLITSQLFAGSPNWTRVDYTSSTTFVGIVKIIQYTPTFGYTPVSGDYIGAFVGNECRMIAQVFTSGSDLYVSSVIQGGDNCAPNEPNCTAGGSETVTFRLWSNSQNKEYASIKGDTLTYPGDNIGSTTPYEIGKPKTDKNLLTLTVTGVTLSPDFLPSTQQYTATISTLPALSDYKYTSSPKSTVTIKPATSLTGTTEEATTTITVTSESGYTKEYKIVFSSSCNLTTAPTLSATPSTLCLGQSTLLSATGNGTTFTWYTDAAGTSVLSNTTVTPTVTTTYYAKQSNATCSSPIGSIIVTVNPLPTISASVLPTSICEGQTATLSATGGNTYIWSNNLGNESSFTVTPSTTTTYTVTGTDANGCSNTNTATIKVNPLPIITAEASPATICIGTSTTLKASGANSYTWDNSLGTGNIITVTPNSTTKVTVTGTDINGCSNTQSVTVKVNPLPNITISASHTSICAGNNSTLTVSGGNSYQWSNGLGSGDSKNVTPNSTTTYSVTGTDNNGCANTNTATVTVNELPSISATANPSKICLGQSATIAATGGESYIWDNNLSPISSNNITPTSSNIYNVTATDANGCKNTASVSLIVNQLPVINVSATPSSICNGSSSELKAIGGVSYIWDNGLNTDATHTVTPTSDIIYNVTGTDANGCSSSNKVTVSVTTPAMPSAKDVTAPVNTTPIPTLSATGKLIKWYDETSSDLVHTGNEFTPNVSSAAPATFKYNITNTDGQCESKAILVSLTFTTCTVGAPTVDIATQSVCPSSSFKTITATGSNIKWYNSKGLIISTENKYTPTEAGEFTVSQTDVCEGAKAKVTTSYYTVPSVSLVATPSSICAGTTSVLTASGASSYIWDNNLTTGLTNTVTPASNTTYKVTGTDINGCTATANANVSVTTPDKPISTDVIVPINTTPIPTLSATGKLIKWYDETSGNLVYTGNDFTPNVSSAKPATFKYNITNTDGQCESKSVLVSLTFSTCTVGAPTIDLATQSVCPGSPFKTITATGSDIKWYNSKGVIISTENTYTPTEAGEITVSQTNVCEGAKAKVTISYYTLPNVSLVATPSSICAGTTSILTASGASSYIWDNNLTTGITNTVTPVSNTTYKITGTDNNGCTATANVVVTVTTPQVPSSSDITVPVNTTPVPALSATGTLIKWYDNISGNLVYTGSPFTPSVSSATSNSYKFKVTNTEGTCESSSILVTLTFSDCKVAEPKVDITSQEICQGGSFKAFNATGTGIQWYNDKGVVVGTKNEFTPINEGTYFVSQTDVCEGAKTKVIATINPTPTVTLPIVPDMCLNDNPYTIIPSQAGGTFSGNDVTPNGVFTPKTATTYTINYTYTDTKQCSSKVSTTITVNNVPAIPTISAIKDICGTGNITLTQTGGVGVVWSDGVGTISPVLSNLAPNTYTFYAQSVENKCKSAQASVTFKVKATPVAPTVTGDKVCEGLNGNLTATAVGSIQWYDAQSTPIATTNSISVSKEGSYYATQTVDNCESPKAKADFVINLKPVPEIISNQAINSGEAIPTFTATRNVNWYNSSKELEKTNFTFVPSVSNTTILTHTFYVDYTSAEGCKSDMTSFSLTIKTANCPSAPTVSSVPACEGESGTVSATGTNINWYDAEIGGNNLGKTATLTVSKPGNYYATQTSNGCESTRALIEFTVTTKPQITINAPSSMKTTDAAIVITATPLGGILSGDNIVLNKFYPNASIAGEKTIKYTVSTGGCTTSASKIIIVSDGSLNTTELEKAIQTATDKKQNASENNLIGNNAYQYPESAVLTLENAIKTATAAETTATSQTEIDNATKALNDAITAFENSINKPGDNSVLAKLIDDALTLSKSPIGPGIGQYPSNAALLSAISTAAAVKNDALATQAVIDDAVKSLQAAIDDFKKTLITGIVATDIEFTSATQSISGIEPVKLTYKFVPENATPVDLIWTSSNPSVVTVDNTGKITAVSVGVTTITVSFKNNPTIYASIFIEVTAIGIFENINEQPIVYPTIVSDVVYIKQAGAVKNIKIVSVTSKQKAIEAKPNADVIMIDVTELSSGSYFMVLEAKDGSTITKTIIKE